MTADKLTRPSMALSAFEVADRATPLRGRARGKKQPWLRIRPIGREQLQSSYRMRNEDLAHEFAAAEPSMPTSLAVELSHLSLASGIAGGALQMQAIRTFEVSDASHCIVVPLNTQNTTGGHAPGHYYTYVFCHDTDVPTATAIFREMQIRPTVPGTGLGANCDADFPPTCFYSQAAVGDMDVDPWRIQVGEVAKENILGRYGGKGTIVLPKRSCPKQGSMDFQCSLRPYPRICHSSSDVTVAPGNMRHKFCRCSLCNLHSPLIVAYFCIPRGFLRP